MSTSPLSTASWSGKTALPAANPLLQSGGNTSSSLQALTGFQSYMQQARQAPAPVQPAPPPRAAAPATQDAEAPAAHEEEAAPATKADKPAPGKPPMKATTRLPAVAARADQAKTGPQEATRERAVTEADTPADHAEAAATEDSQRPEQQAQPDASASGPNAAVASQAQARPQGDDPGAQAEASQPRPGLARKGERRGGEIRGGLSAPGQAQTTQSSQDSSATRQAAMGAGQAGESFSAQLGQALQASSPATAGTPADAASLQLGAQGSTPLQADAPKAADSAQAPAFRVSVPVEDAQFPVAVAVQLARLSQNGIDTAQLNLHPAEMGPLQVTLSLGEDGLKVDLAAQHDTTREVLAQGTAELRQQLEHAGLTVQHVQVHEQEGAAWAGTFQQGQTGGGSPRGQERDGGGPPHAPGPAGTAFVDAGLDAGQARSLGVRHQARGLDLFA